MGRASNGQGGAGGPACAKRGDRMLLLDRGRRRAFVAIIGMHLNDRVRTFVGGRRRRVYLFLSRSDLQCDPDRRRPGLRSRVPIGRLPHCSFRTGRSLAYLRYSIISGSAALASVASHQQAHRLHFFISRPPSPKQFRPPPRHPPTADGQWFHATAAGARRGASHVQGSSSGWGVGGLCARARSSHRHHEEEQATGGTLFPAAPYPVLRLY